MISLFDTHASVKKLEAAGFTEQQAEAQVQVLKEFLHNCKAGEQIIFCQRKQVGVSP